MTAAAASDEVRRRVARVVHSLEETTMGHGVLKDPRSVYLEIALAIHELEAALLVMRRRKLISVCRASSQSAAAGSISQSLPIR